MRKSGLLVMLLLGIVLAAGCGKEKEAPKAVEKAQEEQDVSKEQGAVKDTLPPKTEPQENVTPFPTLNQDTVVYTEDEVLTTDRVNIRHYPSEDSEIYETAAGRTKFLRTADDGTWSAVQIENKEYYIASQ